MALEQFNKEHSLTQWPEKKVAFMPGAKAVATSYKKTENAAIE